MRRYLQNIFTADLRSLALFRIGLGFLVSIDVVFRWTDLTAFYTNQGVLPSDQLRLINPFLFSLHSLNGSQVYQHSLFLLTLISATFLCLGYKTKLTTFATWTLLLSIQNRNPFINYGADGVIILMLLWGNFLPWHVRFSLDSFNQNKKHLNNKIASLGTFTYFMQVAIIYLSTALLKKDPVWITEGLGVYYALSIGQFATPFSELLLQFPSILFISNYLVLFIELFAPLALLWPYKNEQFRTLAIFILILMHIGFGMGLTLEIFSAVMIITLLGLTPTWAWEKIEQIILRYYSFPKFGFITRLIKVSKNQTPPNTSITIFKKTTLVILLVFALVQTLIPFLPVLNKTKPVQISNALQMDQTWNLFAPKPLDYTLWLVAPGILINGQTIDLISQKEVSWKRPPDFNDHYPNLRWKNFIIMAHDQATPFQPYAKYLCNKWNTSHYEKIIQLEIYSVTEKNIYPKQDMPLEVKKEVSYKCV